MGRYSNKINQVRFGQRPSGVGIVWETLKDVDVDHYELFISSKEVDSTQVEAFCRGEVAFAKKFTFDSTVRSVVDNRTPMFSRMVYSLFAVDKTGNYFNVPFIVDDSKNLTLRGPKYLAVEEGPVGIAISSSRGTILAKKSSEKSAEGPWILLEYSEGKFLMTIRTDAVRLADGSQSVPKPFQIRRFSYTLSENQVSGEIMNDRPVSFLEKTHINGENFNISLHLPALSPTIRGGQEPLVIEFYGCKISSTSFSFDGNVCQKEYNFGAQRCLVKDLDEIEKDRAIEANARKPIEEGEAPPPRPPATTTTSRPEETVFCPSCGTRMSRSMAYCPGCGRKVQKIS